MILPRLLAALALGAFVLSSAPPASARPINAWFADDLTEKADVVVMGTVLSNKDGRDFSKEEHKPDDLVPVITTFAVDAVLKGNIPGKIQSLEGVKIELEHMRYFDPLTGILIIDGAFLTSFDPEKHTRYLLFLKKHGNQFVPVTGQYDSYQSFIELGRYYSFHRESTPPTPAKPIEPPAKPAPEVAPPK